MIKIIKKKKKKKKKKRQQLNKKIPIQLLTNLLNPSIILK